MAVSSAASGWATRDGPSSPRSARRSIPSLRGQMLDEALELLQRFLAGEPVSYTRSPLCGAFAATPPDAAPEVRCRSGERAGGRIAGRWPEFAKLQGCFPIFATPGALPPPDPADIRELRGALTALGALPTIDIAVRCALSREDPARVAGYRVRARGIRRDLDARGLSTRRSTRPGRGRRRAKVRPAPTNASFAGQSVQQFARRVRMARVASCLIDEVQHAPNACRFHRRFVAGLVSDVDRT